LLQADVIDMNVLIVELIDFVYNIGEVVELLDLGSADNVPDCNSRDGRQPTRTFRTQECLRSWDETREQACPRACYDLGLICNDGLPNDSKQTDDVKMPSPMLLAALLEPTFRIAEHDTATKFPKRESLENLETVLQERHPLVYDYFLKDAKLESLQKSDDSTSPPASRPDSRPVSIQIHRMRHSLPAGGCLDVFIHT